MGNPAPRPKRLAAKLLAIRQAHGVSQCWMAQLIQIKPYHRISEFERGRRMPSLITLLYYSRIAGIPLEYIVDDDIDLDYFKKYLTLADRKRGELNDPPDYHLTLFWRE